MRLQAMQGLTCPSCHSAIRLRLKEIIVNLKQSRRSFNSSSSIYWDTNPPIDRELAAARWFFQQHPPRKVWTATEWRKQNNDSEGLLVPEVAFLGRSNVGKSSLLNAILGSKDLNRVGPHPGKTKLLHAWGLAASDPKTGRPLKGWKGLTDTRVTVLDAPGYGYGSDKDWGAEIITYLRRRKQLRRIFILIDAVHGPKKHDQQMLKMLREFNIPHQLIASKIDRQKNLASTLHSLQEVAQPNTSHGSAFGLGEILAVGGLEDSIKAKPLGVPDVQWAVLRAAGLDEFAMDNFMRLAKEKALKFAAVARQPNVESHLAANTHVLPVTPLHMAEQTPGPTLVRSAPSIAETNAPPEEDMDHPERHSEVETAPQPQRLNPNVYRGMDAFQEATGQKPVPKSRARAVVARRSSLASRTGRGKTSGARSRTRMAR
jgi:GTP-binding protein